MTNKFKTVLLTAMAIAVLLPWMATGEVRWNYAGTTLTEILPEGSTNTASVYTLTSGGALSKVTHGNTAMLDFRASAMPEGTPAIVSISDIRQNYACKTVYLPDTLTSLAVCAFYQWTNLNHIVFPATGDFVINDLTFDGSAITNAILPVGMKKLGNRAFYGAKKLEHVRLPETLESIGSQAFDTCTSLKLIEPCIPVSVTNLALRALQGCTVMTNGVEIGFATNAVTHEPVMMNMGVYTLWECGKIPYVKFGPSIHSIPHFLYQGCGSVKTIEYGPNVTNILDTVGAASKASLSNIVFRRAADFAFPGSVNVFKDCTKVREVTWGGWFEYTASAAANPFSGWGNLQCRFIVPGDNAKWIGYCSDPTKVLPWDQVTTTDKDTYFTRYGAEASVPVGVSVAVVNGLPRTYIVKTDAVLTGYPLAVHAPNTNFATVAISPAVPESGFYDPDTEVTVSFDAAAGVTFTGWTGNVQGDETNTTLVITMNEAKSLTPVFTSTFWVYENGELADGEFTLNASGGRSAITAGKYKKMKADTVLDLTKPILGGGAVTAIADNTFDSDHNCPKRVYLPETLTSIGKRAFCWCSQTLISPLVPSNVTNIGSEAFLWEYYITGDLNVGFAADASGDPLETTLGASSFSRCDRVGPNVRIGPGVKNIPSSCFYRVGRELTAPMSLYIGPNVTNIVGGAFSQFHSVDNTTRATTIHFQGDMPEGSGAAFIAADYQPLNYKHRYFVSRENCPKWAAFAGDPDKVTPWEQIDAQTQAAYWTNFPEATFGTDHPAGLTTAGSVFDGLGLPSNQWVFIPQPRGLVLILR